LLSRDGERATLRSTKYLIFVMPDSLALEDTYSTGLARRVLK
jgi:hypothetical protein